MWKTSWKCLGRSCSASRFIHYAGCVNAAARSFAIPPAAQEKEARLEAALTAMAEACPSLEPPSLLAFRIAVEAGDGVSARQEWAGVLAGDCVEEAAIILRDMRRESVWNGELEGLLREVTQKAEAALRKRSATVQLDAHRSAARLAYSKASPALVFDAGDLQRILLRAFRLEGVRVALDLARHPRPILQMGPPLPSGVGGKEEWADVQLRREPEAGGHELIARLNRRLPEGIRLLRWQVQPTYATPVAELAEASTWSWPCPEADQRDVRDRMAAFLAADRFLWDKTGKVGGQKQGKQVDLRPMVLSMDLEDGVLRFRTDDAHLGSTNPLKLVGAILEREPASIEGLVRIGTSLRRDARLDQGDRYEPKLSNLYEDAVLLTGGSNITLVEEDEDEPLRLG